ncbi:MAG: hypothetical protein ACYDEC_07905 [Bacteroidia bacterium]
MARIDPRKTKLEEQATENAYYRTRRVLIEKVEDKDERDKKLSTVKAGDKKTEIERIKHKRKESSYMSLRLFYYSRNELILRV